MDSLIVSLCQDPSLFLGPKQGNRVMFPFYSTTVYWGPVLRPHPEFPYKDPAWAFIGSSIVRGLMC